MSDKIMLKDIFIGKADGLAEAKRADFTTLFYNGNKNYNLLKDDESKFLISGRKGTGKTILAKYYEAEMRKSGSLVRFVNGNDILLRHIKEIGTSELNDKYVASFIKYTILYEISTLILDNKRSVLKQYDLFSRWYINKIIKRLEKIILPRRFQGNYTISDFTREVEESVSVESNDDLIGTKFGTKIGKLKKENYTKNSYFSIIDRLEKLVLAIINQVSVAIIFDDIDEYAEKLDGDSLFNSFLTKTIEIISEINEDIHQCTNKNSKIILLLRSDIIDKLQTECTNINKIIVDSQILLNWIGKIDVDNPELNPLFDLILTKMKNSNSALYNKSTKEIYDMFFPKKVNKTETIKYIFRRSHGRPRDIVNLLNIIKKENPDAERFEEKFFISAEKEYSKCFKDELKNEASLTYNGDKISECFRMITLIGKTVFSMDDVKKTMEECNDQIKIIEDAKTFVDMMYEVGAIGNYRKVSGKSMYLFKYREDGADEPDYRYLFVVHQGLRKNLLRK